MAKKPEQGTSEAAIGRLEHVAENVGEGLGHFLNQVESQWNSVRGQRESLVKNLRAIRDKANALLAEAGELDLPIPSVFKRRGRPKGSKTKKTEGSAVPPSVKRGPGRPKRRGMSKEGRERIAAAQRARWAALKAKKSGKG